MKGFILLIGKRKLNIFCSFEVFLNQHNTAMSFIKDKKGAKKVRFLANSKSINHFNGDN
jgi:hypothetical protein